MVGAWVWEIGIGDGEREFFKSYEQPPELNTKNSRNGEAIARPRHHRSGLLQLGLSEGDEPSGNGR